MKKGIYLLPNLFTMGNMFCGFLAIVYAINHSFFQAAVAILVAAVMDNFDGKIARMTHTTSRFGVEFDSLSDLVSFGVAPAILMYTWALKPFGRFGLAAAFLFAVCGAMRLARFNVQFDSSSNKDFTGLPIPAAAGVVASIVIINKHLWGIETHHPLLLMFVAYILAFLMVSTIKYNSFKEFDLKQRKPFSLLVTASLIVFVVIAEPQFSLFLIFIGYALSGIVRHVLSFRFSESATKTEVQRRFLEGRK